MFLHHEEQASQAATYPDHIVNGDFSYPQLSQSQWQNWYGTLPSDPTETVWVHIMPNSGQYGYGQYSNQRWTLSGFNKNTFGWNTTDPYNAIELQSKVSDHSMQWAELVADTAGASIYQDVSTTPGSVYQWTLKHAASRVNLTSSNPSRQDSMQVLIGNTTKQSPQLATRTISNGYDPVGRSSTTITSTMHYSRYEYTCWNTYSGTYVIPAGQTVTRFTFKSIASSSATTGNRIDDITFTITDPLYYDLNGGTGNLPTPQASGTYPGYYQRGTSVTLSDIIPTRSGYTFLGWSEQKHADIVNTSIPANITFVKQKQIEAGDNYVYAVWAKNPTITFKDSITGNTVSTVQLLYNASVAANDIPSVPEHAGYRFTGYSIAPTSKFIQDTEIKLQYEPAGRIQVNVEWIDRDNLAGSREDLQLSIPQAADPSASHDITISKDADTITIPYLPSVNDPKEEIVLSAESKYDLTSVSISKVTDTNGITTIIYNISIKYIPFSDLVITKLWDDDNDRYQERPDSIIVEIYCDDVELPADTDEEFSEDDHWRLYDTIVISRDPAAPDSDSWTAVVPAVPLWSSRGYSGDVLVDAHYKIKELPVQGYDLISCDGSVQDGFRIENKVFGHVSIPSTGSNSHAFVIALTLAVVSITAAFALISILRSRKSTRTL